MRPGLAVRRCQNRETYHMLREVWNKAVLKQEAKVFFSPAFAECIYTLSSWLPLVHFPLETFSICHAHMQKKNQNPGDSTPIPEKNLHLSLTVFSKTFIKETEERGGTQARCFLAFHTRNRSQQDHKCLGWQREGDSVSP